MLVKSLLQIGSNRPNEPLHSAENLLCGEHVPGLHKFRSDLLARQASFQPICGAFIMA